LPFVKAKPMALYSLRSEQSQPIALLKNRSAETLTQWLKAHPGIKVVSRDRAKAYASGISQGAPEAIQVADRFHLLQNLGETLERVFHVHSKDLKEVDEAYSQIEVIQTDGTVVAPVPPPPTLTKQERLAEQRRTQRLAIYQQGKGITSPRLVGTSYCPPTWYWSWNCVSLLEYSHIC
jgi:hypothetical protein